MITGNNILRRVLLTLIAVSVTILLDAQTNAATLGFTTDTVFRNAGISICVRDVHTGEIITGHNENLALTSASIMKLVTTGTALEALGPDYVYRTRIALAGELEDGTLNGYIIIMGGGDPALGSQYFSEHYGDFIYDWVAAIKDEGIDQLNGRVVADASVFSYVPALPGWSWSDLGNYYGAGVHGLSVFDNMYRIKLSTGMEGTAPDILGVEPQVPGLQVESHLRASGNRDNGYVYLPPYGSRAVIEGTVPVLRDTFVLKASLPDPPLLLATILHNRLIDAGVTINSHPSTHRELPGYLDDSLMATLRYISTTESPPMAEIIQVTNRESVNLFAEALLFTLDYRINNHLSAGWSGGLDVVSSTLDSLNISKAGLYMTDGSGLSRSNSLSAAFITGFLAGMKSESDWPELFRASLAVPGEGTFEPYFLDPALKGNLCGKSGTVGRVRNYAGYMTTASGREISFGVLTNNFDCTSHEVSRKVEQLLLGIYSSY